MYSDKLFSKALTDIMEERGIEGKELAQKIRVGSTYISLLKNGKIPAPKNPRSYKKLAKVLGIEPEYFKEYRELLIIRELDKNPKLLNRVFALLYKYIQNKSSNKVPLPLSR